MIRILIAFLARSISSYSRCLTLAPSVFVQYDLVRLLKT